MWTSAHTGKPLFVHTSNVAVIHAAWQQQYQAMCVCLQQGFSLRTPMLCPPPHTHTSTQQTKHRTRFIPPGGRQGPLARGTDGSVDPCEALADTSAAAAEACRYNARVKLASKEYTPDSCSAEWLYDTSLTGTSTARGPICYPGTTFLYSGINECEFMSSDMRLSAAIAGGPPSDKCAAPAWQDGGQAVRADDFWSAVVSHEHDPCGWPFSECVADCSLPSDISTKAGWSVAANGTVLDASKSRPVGCTDQGCAAADMMQDPRIANQIAAM